MFQCYTLRTVCDYFNNRGGPVYITSLDASKAFDRAVHAKLFALLIAKKVPACFINVMIDWYSKLYAVVRWNDTESASFHITSGVRQGGVLSPIMFDFYINDLILTLKSSDLGCHVQDDIHPVVELSNIELVELSNRRMVEWWSCRIVECWNAGVVESSNGGMLDLSKR